MSRFRSLFANTDAPVMWAGLVVGLVCALGAAGLCSLINPHVAPLGLIIAGMLGLVAASAPMFMALRLVLLIGLLMLVSSVLAMAVRDHPVTAALTMAAVAMVTSVWTALPVVGRIFSSLPTLVFVMLLAKGQEFTGAASTLDVGLAVLAAVAVPMVVAVLLSARDPRKYDREMAAAMWAGDTDAAKLGTFSRVLLLDGAPPPLLYLAAHGMFGRVCERWLHSRDADSPALPVAQANAGLLAKALLPRGPLQPRQVELTELPTPEGDSGGDSGVDPAGNPTGETAVAVALWSASQHRGQRVLAGEQVHRVVLRPLLLLASSLLRTVLRPDASVFRYGVQRALVLGVGAAVLVAAHNDENAFWVLITMTAVLQANAPSTAARVARRAAGTLVGVVVAVLLARVLPDRLLVPWVAGIVLVLGLAWMQRNYTVSSMAMGFSAVLLYGAPTHQVGTYAVFRAVDVVIGGLIAAGVAKFVLPVVPQLTKRRGAVLAAMRGLLQGIALRGAHPDLISMEELAARQAAVSTAMTNLETDISLTSDESVVKAYEADSQQLAQLESELYVTGLTVVDLRGDAALANVPLTAALNSLEVRVKDLSEHPPTVPGAAGQAASAH